MKLVGPKLLLRLEGLFVLSAACVIYRQSDYHWGKFFLLFLLPDLSMVGYAWGPGVGARAYNAVHTYLAPSLLWILADYGHRPVLLPLALIWIAHIGFDRLLGYGLKYDTAFKDTHLGRL